MRTCKISKLRVSCRLLVPLMLLLPVLFDASPAGSRANSAGSRVTKEEIYQPNQISASLMVKYMKQSMEEAASVKEEEAEQRYLMVYDLYIKARSYALFNKIFFWFAVVSAVIVLLWPSLGIIFKGKVKDAEWFRSAIAQTTITGIAALTFSFYSQYKDKQTYTENLIRYVVFSDEDVDSLAAKVVEEIGKIDRGFSFSSLGKGDERVRNREGYQP